MVIVNSDITTDPTINVRCSYPMGTVDTPNNIPINLSDKQLLNIYRLCLPSSNFVIRYNYAPSVDYGYYCYVSNIPILPSTSFFSTPVEASKFWARIKGFFTSAWKAIKNIVPKVAKVVSPILPPPYGTVVAGVGAGVSAVDNVINTITTASVKQTSVLAGSVKVEDTDVFEITP